MKEFDDLMIAIENACSELSELIADDETGEIARIRMELLEAKFMFHAAPEPLVLEQVDFNEDISTAFVDKWSRVYINDKCYRLPSDD